MIALGWLRNALSGADSTASYMNFDRKNSTFDVEFTDDKLINSVAGMIIMIRSVAILSPRAPHFLVSLGILLATILFQTHSSLYPLLTTHLV